MVIAYLGVGANLGQPEHQLQVARTVLSKHYAIQVLEFSSMYLSAAQGSSPFTGKRLVHYVNAVWKIQTSLPPHLFLSVLNSIERRLGRKRLRSSKNLPRPLDMDLLLYGSQRINTKQLIVPHPRMHLRRFVIEPLAEIAPRLIVPGVGPVQNLLKQNRIMAQAVELLPSQT